METFLQDLRYAIRVLIKKPAFASLAILALALGIGANSAIFSVVNAVLLRPLPFPDADKLVWVWDTQPQLENAPSSVADFLDWREQNQSFEYMAAFQDGDMFFDRGEGNEDIHVGLVTPDMFVVESEPNTRANIHGRRNKARPFSRRASELFALEATLRL